MQLQDYTCLLVSDAIVEHEGFASTGRHSDFAIYHGYRNLEWAYFKNMPWPSILWYFPLHFVMNLIVLAGFMVRGKAKAILKAKWHALLGMRRIFKQRRKIQQQSTVDRKVLLSRMSKESFIQVLRGKNILR